MLFEIFVSFVLSQGFASEVASANPVSQKLSPAVQEPVIFLGNCKPASRTEEATARKFAEQAALSKEELLARLIYSEALSTGYWNRRCHANSAQDLFTTIGWGIMNRVKTKSVSSLDAYSDVIFAEKQFSTSFSGKKANPFAAAFLCPLESQKYLDKSKSKGVAQDLFKQVSAVSRDIIRDFESSGIPEKYRGITNFFYPHSEYFGELRPAWAKNKDPKKNRGYINLLGAKSNPCAEFYRLK